MCDGAARVAFPACAGRLLRLWSNAAGGNQTRRLSGIAAGGALLVLEADMDMDTEEELEVEVDAMELVEALKVRGAAVASALGVHKSVWGPH